jgi:subtilisin family serine protease
MFYVLDHANEISIVNMSFGNPDGNAPIDTIGSFLKDLVSKGVVVVASAGNSSRDLAGLDGIYGTSDDYVPAALPEAMAVSATDPTIDTLADFSNFSQIERTNGYLIDDLPIGTNYVHSPGGAIDVAAPGVNILTTYTASNYIFISGTSFSAPHVTGLVALYIAANGRATNAEGVWRIRQAIIDASLPQSQWNTNNTHDPDTNSEPLAIASEAWIPKPEFTTAAGMSGNFQLNFNVVPGYDYTIQSSTNSPSLPGWTTLATFTGTNFVTSISLMDSNAAAFSFYRLARTPSP